MRRSSRSPTAKDITVDSRVLVRGERNGVPMSFHGRVVAQNADGTLEVHFADGDCLHLAASSLKLLDDSELRPITRVAATPSAATAKPGLVLRPPPQLQPKTPRQPIRGGAADLPEPPPPTQTFEEPTRVPKLKAAAEPEGAPTARRSSRAMGAPKRLGTHDGWGDVSIPPSLWRGSGSPVKPKRAIGHRRPLASLQAQTPRSEVVNKPQSSMTSCIETPVAAALLLELASAHFG